VDHTGLTGAFEVDLKWSPEPNRSAAAPAVAGDPDHPTIFSELRDKLGLRVGSGKAPVDTVVVDHVEKTPVEN
jgi:uncharacterized protein (TIGR03435 family)